MPCVNKLECLATMVIASGFVIYIGEQLHEQPPFLGSGRLASGYTCSINVPYCSRILGSGEPLET